MKTSYVARLGPSIVFIRGSRASYRIRKVNSVPLPQHPRNTTPRPEGSTTKARHRGRSTHNSSPSRRGGPRRRITTQQQQTAGQHNNTQQPGADGGDHGAARGQRQQSVTPRALVPGGQTTSGHRITHTRRQTHKRGRIAGGGGDNRNGATFLSLWPRGNTKL